MGKKRRRWYRAEHVALSRAQIVRLRTLETLLRWIADEIKAILS